MTVDATFAQELVDKYPHIDGQYLCECTDEEVDTLLSQIRPFDHDQKHSLRLYLNTFRSPQEAVVRPASPANIASIAADPASVAGIISADRKISSFFFF
jgi:hypothetical protein